MPLYSFIDTKTDTEFDDIMSISDMEEFLSKNPHIKQVLKPIPHLHDVGGIKTDGGWRDMLKRIKKGNRGSKIDTGNLGSI